MQFPLIRSRGTGGGGDGGGQPGAPGQSAYQVAQSNGYQGTKQEWLASLVGESAYQSAVEAGFVGSEADWIASMQLGSRLETIKTFVPYDLEYNPEGSNVIFTLVRNPRYVPTGNTIPFDTNGDGVIDPGEGFPEMAPAKDADGNTIYDIVVGSLLASPLWNQLLYYSDTQQIKDFLGIQSSSTEYPFFMSQFLSAETEDEARAAIKAGGGYSPFVSFLLGRADRAAVIDALGAITSSTINPNTFGINNSGVTDQAAKAAGVANSVMVKFDYVFDADDRITFRAAEPTWIEIENEGLATRRLEVAISLNSPHPRDDYIEIVTQVKNAQGQWVDQPRIDNFSLMAVNGRAVGRGPTLIGGARYGIRVRSYGVSEVFVGSCNVRVTSV